MYDGTNSTAVTKNVGEFGAVSPVEIAEMVRQANQMRAAVIGEAIADVVAGTVLRYRRWKTTHAAIRELESLDERLLADIGITRDQIRALAIAAPLDAVPARGSVVAGFVNDRLVEPFKRWRTRNRTRQELTALDDATLRDIGIERGQIDGIAAAVSEGKLSATGTPVPIGLALGFLDLPRPANSNNAQPRPALVNDAAD